MCAKIHVACASSHTQPTSADPLEAFMARTRAENKNQDLESMKSRRTQVQKAQAGAIRVVSDCGVPIRPFAHLSMRIVRVNSLVCICVVYARLPTPG